MHEDALSRSLLNHSKASSASATGARWRSVNRVNTAVNTSDSEAERTRHRDTHPAFAELGESLGMVKIYVNMLVSDFLGSKSKKHSSLWGTKKNMK